jgi:integrase
MTVIRVRGFQIFRDRHGKWRCYHRKTRTPVDLARAPIGSAEFFAECNRIADLVKATAPKPGTFGLLVTEYRASPAFFDLAPRTKADYQRILDYLSPLSGVSLARFDRPLVVKIRDKAQSKGIRFANYTRSFLSTLFAWGAERGYLKANPAEKIKCIRRPRGMPDANRPWSDGEREAVLATVPAHMKPAIALMMFTGLGPKDALTLPRSFYRDDEVATNRSKTGEPVFWPAPAPLVEILNEAPSHSAITLCANSAGLPWTDDGFRASWRKVRLLLEKEGDIGSGLTLYGLRHTVAVILREMGRSERDIADALGQKTTEMARRYARGADLRPKMRGIVKDFEFELNKRQTKVVKPTA